MKTIKLLLIEDDLNLSYLLKSTLEDIIGGYEVYTASNGEEGLKQLESFTPDIIVSDIEMPVLNGFEMVKKIRQTNSDLPIIFATGRQSPIDVTAGYGVGVDNYIKKPFIPEELDAHVKRLIELKTDTHLKLRNKIYKIGKYTFEPAKFTLIYPDSSENKLTPKESKILELLVINKGEIVKREDILNALWENMDTFFASRSLDVFISKLRGYLSNDPSISITNIKSIGLVMDFE